MPRAREESEASGAGIRPLHVFMGVAFAAIATVMGIAAVTLISIPSPPPPRPSAPAVAALPTPAAQATLFPTPTPTSTPPGTPAPTSNPTATDRPTGTGTPEATEIKPSRVIPSSNWSGYGLRNEEYTSVSAEWTQPVVDCSSGKVANASIWVGLDGVKSHTVEQTGTAADCRAGITTRTSYYAWYEMYPEAMRLSPVIVHAGDRFSALVQEVSTGKFAMTLKNLTTGQTFTKSASRSGGEPTSAEWVVEPAALCTPTCVGSQLAQFADMTFSNLAAETTDGSVSFATAASQLVEFDLRSKKGQLAHVSSLAGDAPSFDITWVGTHQTGDR